MKGIEKKKKGGEEGIAGIDEPERVCIRCAVLIKHSYERLISLHQGHGSRTFTAHRV